MPALTLFLLAAVVAAQQMIWNQSFEYAYFNDISTALSPVPGGAAFALGTSVNKPHVLEAYDATGAPLFSISDNRSGAAFTTASARHAEDAATVGAVDLAVISYYWDGTIHPEFGLPCVVNGFATSSPAPALPKWTFTTNASLGCAFSSLAFSDDGSTVALAAMVDVGTGALAPALFVLQGQTGALAWSSGGTDPSKGSAGGAVWLSARGTWLVHSHGMPGGAYLVEVMSGADGTVRGSVGEGWNTPGMLSEDGNYLVVGGQDNCMFYNYTGGAYQPALPRFRPGDGTDWYVADIAVTSDGSGAEEAELVSLAWTRFDSKVARVTTLSLVTGRLLSDWSSSPVNTQFGNGARLSMDGAFTGVALEGDNNDSPTAVILFAGSNDPLLSFTSRGSMNSAALVLEKNTSMVFAVSGKVRVFLGAVSPPPPRRRNTNHLLTPCFELCSGV